MSDSEFANQKNGTFNETNNFKDSDLLMEKILENINSTPIGQVLNKIAELPEIRQQKVLELRNKITKGQYDLNQRLDLALERVLEDLEKQSYRS